MVEEHRGALRVSYPIEHGVVRDWEDMERVWAHAYAEENLNVPSEEHPVLLTEAPLNPAPHRERAAQCFFETFNVPGLFMSPQATLSLYASGRTTGVVLDVGDGVAHTVPVYEGFALPHAITRMDVGGRDVTEYMQLLLRKAGHPFHTSAEREVVRSVKEALCYVAFNPADEEALAGMKGTAPKQYRLPDGSIIDIGPERFRAPELLFTPSLLGLEYPGVHRCLHNAILRADLDLRRVLYSQVVLAGGSTMFRGFGDRLLNELRKLAPKDTKLRIAAPPERASLTWTGGSILASLGTFKSMWVRKEEYAEVGPNILHKRSL